MDMRTVLGRQIAVLEKMQEEISKECGSTRVSSKMAVVEEVRKIAETIGALSAILIKKPSSSFNEICARADGVTESER